MKIGNIENSVENKIVFYNVNIKNDLGADSVYTQNGITLIALIITIILMLILAGVVISLTIGNNGLFSTAKYAVVKTKEETAREKLELALADLQACKYTDESYDETEYINKYLTDKQMQVVGDIIEVDGWKFEIDRSVPKIKANLGQSEIYLSKQVKEYLGKNENNKYMVAVLLKIESNTKIESVEFENTDGTIFTITPEEKTVTKDIQIELDREYKVKVNTSNGKQEIKKIIEKSVEEIRTKEELVEFRNKVNSGLTYEGKTINMMGNIDLSPICYKVDGTIEKDLSWEPIGTEEKSFKGTFDGQYNTISNLYINSNLYQSCGLFGCNKGIIKNVILAEVSIKNTTNNSVSYNGGIVGLNEESIINCAVKSGKVQYEGTHTTESYLFAGGIVGANIKTIENCYNGAEIICTNTNTNAAVRILAGGITASNGGSTAKVENCYNKGIVNAAGGTASAVGGIAGANSESAIIRNSYNYGILTKTGGALVGGIVGRNRSVNVGKIENSYCTKNTTYSYYDSTLTSSGSTAGRIDENDLKGYAGTLGEAFISDGKKRDKDGNIVDNLDKDENIIYINEGYPVLKWQIEI